MATYSFDTEHAEKYGLDEAVLIHNMIYWIRKNQANENNIHDGRTWTYNSNAALAQLFPFWSTSKVRRVVNSLVKQCVIIKGNYNKSAYDRTTWFAFVNELEFTGSNACEDKQKSICRNRQMENTETANQFDGTDEPIPNSKTNSKQQIVNTDREGEQRKTNKSSKIKFKPPAIEQVSKYMRERNESIDLEEANRFFDHYSANGWKVGGRAQMRDWKAAVRNWLRNDFSGRNNQSNASTRKNDQAEYEYTPIFSDTKLAHQNDIDGECEVLG